MKSRTVKAQLLVVPLSLMSLLLSACGGTGKDEAPLLPATPPPSSPSPAPPAPAPNPVPTPTPVPAPSPVPPTAIQGMPMPIPPDAAAKGSWSGIKTWPIIPIHMVLLPDGRVLNYGSNVDGNPTGSFVYDLWDPAAGFVRGSHNTLSNTTGTPGVDIFCSAQLVLPQPDAGVLIAGGDTYPRDNNLPDTDNNDGNEKAILFQPRDNTLDTLSQTMHRGRWYGTTTTLTNGEVYIQGGTSKGGDGRGIQSGVDFPEVRQTTGEFRLLTGARTGDPSTDAQGNDAGHLRYYYPRNFVAPDARIFGFDTNGKMYYVDPAGTGAITPLGQLEDGLLGDESTAAMFSPGRILQAGARSNQAAIIDISSGAPVVTATGRFSSLRMHASGTLLPNGELLLTGGSDAYNQRVGEDHSAERWNPVTGQWTLGAANDADRVRLYHSNALLMPDGSVLTGGGGAPGPQTNLDVEIYFPPYLYANTSLASLAQRPQITSLPASPQLDRSFALQVDDASRIARVTMLKSGSATHNFNMDQRFVELSFTVGAGNQLSVRMPSNPGDMPPGYYLLFVLDTVGVPSIGKSVFVNVAGTSDPQNDPAITNPGTRSNALGAAITPFTVAAADPNQADTLSFAAGRLPPGIAINSSSGQVSGTPTALGHYYAVISVADGTGRTATANLVWHITP
ncbi:MAG: galactose oxidase-like domain-containing protein [Pseudomonadota bacterium]